MMFFYNIGIRLYGLAIKTVSLFNRKAGLWVMGRKNIFNRLESALKDCEGVVWVHCASLGEFEQGRPFIEGVRERHPGKKILLTFFSPSGYEIRKDYEVADFVFYLPLDTPRNVRRFIDIVRPEKAVFVKYEFWLNYLACLRGRNIPTYIISAIFRKDSVFFKPYGGIFREALKSFRTIFVQDEGSRELLSGIGVCNAVVAGDTRFDRVAKIASAAKKLDVLEAFADGNKLFVGGSTWPADEDILVQLINSHPGLKFVIAPHEIENSRIEKLMASVQGVSCRYTQVDAATDFSGVRLLVVDTIGILSSVYRYAAYCYIGGGFGAGIHNTLEAATFGLPIAFGPNYGKFREAREMIALGTSVSISSYGELDSWLTGLESSPVKYAEVKAKALSYISYNTGATDVIMSAVFPEEN